DGKLKVGDVEKLVQTEVKKREDALNQKLKDAKQAAKTGEKEAAIPALRSVADEKCMFPDKARDAAKELKKLGVTDVGEILPAPNFDRALSAKIESRMRGGLKAENDAKYREAEK